LAGWTAVSGCDERQADAEIMAQWGDGFQGHVAGTLNGPFIILFEQQCTNQPDHRGFVREDTHDLTAPFDLALSRSSGLVLWILVRCCAGKPMSARTSASA